MAGSVELIPSLQLSTQEVNYCAILSSTVVDSFAAMHKTTTEEEDRLGRRVGQRLGELGWRPVDLLNRIPELDKATLSALVSRNSQSSRFSERIADELGVEHRWLTTGMGPKLKSEKWPFKRVTRGDLAGLPAEDISRIEGYIEARLEEHRQADFKRTA